MYSIIKHFFGWHNWKYSWYKPQNPMRRCYLCGKTEHLQLENTKNYDIEWIEF